MKRYIVSEKKPSTAGYTVYDDVRWIRPMPLGDVEIYQLQRKEMPIWGFEWISRGTDISVSEAVKWFRRYGYEEEVV